MRFICSLTVVKQLRLCALLPPLVKKNKHFSFHMEMTHVLLLQWGCWGGRIPITNESRDRHFNATCKKMCSNFRLAIPWQKPLATTCNVIKCHLIMLAGPLKQDKPPILVNPSIKGEISETNLEEPGGTFLIPTTCRWCQQEELPWG